MNKENAPRKKGVFFIMDSSFVIYLLLSTFISFYLQGKRSLRKLSNITST